jgi:UDP-3-O-[3-hydroxymyristoyl] glucosamine N-acyltransferase
MGMKLSEIAAKLNCDLQGDGSIEINRVVGIEEARGGDLTFLSNPKYTHQLKLTQASAIIISKEAPPLPISTLRTENAYLAFAKCIELFYSSPKPHAGIHPTAIISSSAQIGKSPSIGAFVFIDDEVTIGDYAILFPHVVIYRGARIGNDFLAHSHVVVREYCEIGHNVILQNGVVIGADGFGFAKQTDSSYYKIIQSGKVVLEDNVEVQANATIDRSAVGETRISKGSKVDNLVQVGHGSRVGENTLLCAQVGLAGSTQVGANVILTGQVGVAGHCKIGDNVIATAQSGIPGDVPSGAVVSGYPAIDNKLWLKCSILFSKLPEFNKKIKDLQLKVDKLLGQD